ERALLIVLGEVGHQIAAEATISDSGLIVRAREAVDSAHPESVVQYVVRTADTVVIDDAMIQPEFAMDPYVRQRQVRSVLCLPLTTQARLVAV
ncbi:GAF domain-containing protein, partial [Acinetobacter baumannii]